MPALPLQLRIGKVLEDLDALAGTVVLEHCRNADGSPPEPYVALVTASVDRIKLQRQFGMCCGNQYVALQARCLLLPGGVYMHFVLMLIVVFLV